jgi:hypothetical protein
VRTVSFKNLLELAVEWPCASHEIAFGCHHVLLIGVLDFFPDTANACPCGEVAHALLLPLLPTFRALLVPLVEILGDAVWLSKMTTPASTEVKAGCDVE